MDEIKKRVTSYWDARAASFTEHKQAELESHHAEGWLKEIEKHVTLKKGMRVLDIGTGAGFLATLCAQKGCDVSGIDISEEMIASAEQMAQQFNVNATFQVMDAENLTFDDATFDLVISRNVMWTLPHTERAYTSWMRVLKPDGVLLNIDADYGHDSLLDDEDLPEQHAHKELDKSVIAESEALKQALDISKHIRPQYDIDVLASLGYKDVVVDTDIYERMYKEKDQFYNPTPIFLIKVNKG